MDISIPYYEDNTRISRSSLKWFEVSPRYFKDMLDGKEEGLSGKSIDKGIMTHSYLLEYDDFKKTYKILDFQIPASAQQKQFCQDYIDSNENKPILKALEAFKKNYSTTNRTDEESAKKGLEMALKLKSYIKWLRNKSGEQKTMTWSEFNGLKLTKENVLLHKKAKELLYNEESPNAEYYNEFHINWEYKTKSGRVLKCKSLLDRLIIDHENKTIKLIDLKTTADVNNFSKSFKEYDYAMQMAYYWSAVYWYMTYERKIDVSDWKNETYIIAVRNNTDYSCRVFSVNDEIILSKTTKIEQILSEIDWHFTNNLWDYSRVYYEGDGVEQLIYD